MAVDKANGISGSGQEIWQQISLSTKMSCGARNGVSSNDPAYIHFTVGRGNSHKIRVLLNGKDLYDVDHVKINLKTQAVTVLEEEDDVFAEDLSEVIYAMVNK